MDNTTTNVQEWISVKERLPADNDQRLLVFDGKAISFGRYFHTTEFGSIFGISGWGLTYNVTHWMPLPAPPTEGLVVSEGLIDHGV